ncbi:MAG TPA: hypothetical protein VEU47_18085 [Candidatus Cybelea sp.]|nr:hypothetical protein [Candidatus Cybelea sp.]
MSANAMQAQSSPAIGIVIIQPAGYIHSMAFLEVARYFAALIEACGYRAKIAKNVLDPSRLNIVLGAHLLADGATLPPGSVIFNGEQLPEANAWFKTKQYGELLRNFHVWDYSQANLSRIPHDDKRLVSFFFCEKLRTIRAGGAKDIPLLFYGSINERRKRLIEAFGAAGVKPVVLNGIYGPERDSYIARSRAVLNLHFYEAQVFEQIRCFYPLINGVPVISETYAENSAPAPFADALFLPGGEGIVDYAVRLLKSDGDFDAAAQRKLAKFRELDPRPQFAAALDAALEQHRRVTAHSNPVFPSRINLGSGKDYRPGYLNIDVLPEVGADLEIDLSRPMALPLTVRSRSYGEFVLNPGTFEEIVANDVLEHVPDLSTLVTQCLSLLKLGGKFRIQVPYDLSLGAWQDPTHVRAFNENSWLYYTEWFWYMGWLDHRFDLTELRFNFTPLGQALKKKGIQGGDIVTTPRAIDSMSMVLTKRETTMEERQMARAFSHTFHLDL